MYYHVFAFLNLGDTHCYCSYSKIGLGVYLCCLIRVAYIHSQTTLAAVVCISHIQTIHHIIVIMWYIIENDGGRRGRERGKEGEKGCMLILFNTNFYRDHWKIHVVADNSRSVYILYLNCFKCFIYGEVQVCRSKKDDANS